MNWDQLKIDQESDIPVYQQLAGVFSSMITNGGLSVGDSLPTENALCQRLNISRSTVRQAFQMLEDDGLIVRKRRIGTRVCKPKLKRNLNNLYNFTTEMLALGLNPSSRVINFRTMHPPVKIATKLNIDQSRTVFLIQRLRMANGEPLLLETAYIPTNFCANLTKSRLNDSLYAMISEYSGVAPGEASETYEAVGLTKQEAVLLNAHPGDPALRIQRTSKNTAGETFEYCTIIARGDRNKYQIVLKSTGIQYSRVL